MSVVSFVKVAPVVDEFSGAGFDEGVGVEGGG